MLPKRRVQSASDLARSLSRRIGSTTGDQGRYLSAARAVLARADRPIHYEQITAIALKLGLLSSTSANPEIAMSSMLSADIRVNRHSIFAKERRGVYKLTNARSTHAEPSAGAQHTLERLIISIQVKSEISSDVKVAKRALHLAGCTLDIANDSKVTTYNDTDGSRCIQIHVAELLGDLDVDFAEDPLGSYVSLGVRFARPYDRLARRLQLDDPRIAIYFSLFLLDLALDTIGPDGLLVVRSQNTSLQLPIKSTGRTAHAT